MAAHSDGSDGVAQADGAVGQDVGPEPAAVDQGPDYAGVGHPGQVRAGLGQAHAAQLDRPYAEATAHQMVESHALGDDVAPGRSWGQLDPVVPQRGFDRLLLDEGELASGTALVRPPSITGCVAVPLDALAGPELHLRPGCHRPARLCRYVQPHDLALVAHGAQSCLRRAPPAYDKSARAQAWRSAGGARPSVRCHTPARHGAR